MAGKKTTGLRVPPQDLEAEKAVLGSIMLRPVSLNEIGDVLTPDSFYAEKHNVVYRAMQDLFNKGEPVDLLSLSNYLRDKKLMDKVGSSVYLAEVINTVPSSTNIKHYAGIVQNKYIQRTLIEAGDYVAELGFNEEGEEIDELLDKVEKKIFSATSSPRRQKYLTINETLQEAWERLERLHEKPGELRGIPTGFWGLDQLLAGLQKSDLIILAARPSMGKTALVLDIARQTAIQGANPVAIFSLEMSAQQLVDRMLAAESRVDAWNLRTGRLRADEEFSKIRDALGRLSKAPIFIDDQPSNSINRMRSIARKLKLEKNLALVVVDYLQLMTTTKDYNSMVSQVTEISRSLKSLAKELNIPVLAVSQLSRAVETRGGKPRLSDLRDSGSIEQDADVVMFIHRDDKYKEDSEQPNIAEILVEKHRNGPTGRIELYFDKKTTTFLTIEKSSFENLALAGQEGAVDDF